MASGVRLGPGILAVPAQFAVSDYLWRHQQRDLFQMGFEVRHAD